MFVKILAGIGAVLGGLVLIAVIGFGAALWYGRGLDTDSKNFVDAAVPAIAQHWSYDEWSKRAMPELRPKIKPADFSNIMQELRPLGAMTKYEGSVGQANVNYMLGSGAHVSASYTANAKFEHGEVRFTLVLVRRGDRWQIQDFRADRLIGS